MKPSIFVEQTKKKRRKNQIYVIQSETFSRSIFHSKSLQKKYVSTLITSPNTSLKWTNEPTNEKKRFVNKNAWIRPILFISTDFSNHLEYRSHSCCMCVKLNEPNILLSIYVNESFRCTAITLTSKKPQIMKIAAIEWEQCQRNTKCWGIRQFTQSSALQQKQRNCTANTHMIAKNANSRKVLKSVFFVEFFEKFYFDFYLLPCIDPIFKHKSRLTLFAQTWRRRKKQQRNEIALVEYGKICRKKTS